MRVLAACSLGGMGHLRPLLPLLAVARSRGHDIVLVGPAATRSAVESAGYRFRAGNEPPERVVTAIREQLPVVTAKVASELANRDLFAHLAADAMLPVVESVFAEWRPDLVLRDPCEYASAVVAGRRGRPTAQVAISLAQVEDGSITVAAPALEGHRKGLVAELRQAPYLSRFPPSLDPSPFPRTMRYRTDPPPEAPLPDWWAGSENPLIYASLGTVFGHLSTAAAAYRQVVDVLAEIPVRALLTVGEHLDIAVLGSIPASVHVEPWVDQVGIIQHSAVVLCHGGSGTAFGALEAGVPVVMLPSFADQYENASRISARGAGLIVKPQAAHMSEALRAVLGNPTYKQAARNVAAEMAEAPHIDTVLGSLFD